MKEKDKENIGKRAKTGVVTVQAGQIKPRPPIIHSTSLLLISMD